MSYFLSKLLVLTVIGSAAGDLAFWHRARGGAIPRAQRPHMDDSGCARHGGDGRRPLDLGLCARTEEVATAMVPIAVLPQIILAGLIAPLSGALSTLPRGSSQSTGANTPSNHCCPRPIWTS